MQVADEVWANTGAEGYEVSNFGSVRSVSRTIVRSNGSPTTIAGRILKLTKHRRGYLRVGLGGRRQGRLVHRVVLEAFVGPSPAGCECRHLDGDKINNSLSNLKWGTPLENGADRIRHGTTATPMARLTTEDIPKIRSLLETMTQKDVGDIFGVSQMTISDIDRGKTWRNVK